MGVVRYKPQALTGRPKMTPSLEWAGQVGCPGRILFGDGCTTALPWAARELPMVGRQILLKPADVFREMRGD